MINTSDTHREILELMVMRLFERVPDMAHILSIREVDGYVPLNLLYNRVIVTGTGGNREVITTVRIPFTYFIGTPEACNRKNDEIKRWFTGGWPPLGFDDRPVGRRPREGEKKEMVPLTKV